MALEVIGSVPSSTIGRMTGTGRAFKTASSTGSWVGYNLGFLSGAIEIANDGTSSNNLQVAFTDDETAPTAAHGQVNGPERVVYLNRREQYVWVKHTASAVTFRITAW